MKKVPERKWTYFRTKEIQRECTLVWGAVALALIVASLFQ